MAFSSDSWNGKQVIVHMRADAIFPGNPNAAEGTLLSLTETYIVLEGQAGKALIPLAAIISVVVR